MQPKHAPIALIILDGWGYRESHEYNAIAKANTPTWNDLWAHYTHTLISCSGHDVGLPDQQMGNSEVGHLHMGAGRQVPQDLVRVDDAIADGSFLSNPALNNAFSRAIQLKSRVHVIGLLSPGGVHSHEAHIQALVTLAEHRQCHQLEIHAILDGRDTPPRSALASIASLEKHLKAKNTGRLASIIGRYYAMDRDNRWDRIQLAYDLLTKGSAPFTFHTAAEALEQAYERDESDEFVQGTIIDHPSTIQDNDVVIFMNFRSDRARQLTRALTEKQFTQFTREKIPKIADFVSLTQYAVDIQTTVAFAPQNLDNVVGEYLAKHHVKQLRIAETEKYAHVTFFFNGGREKPFENEDRILIPSPKVSTYDLQPEMSAIQVTDKLVEAILSQQYGAIICNFANADMVGHTGNIPATIQAIETIDQCLKRIIEALLSVGGEALITADHGNAEFMFDELTHQPHTAHTSNLVPALYVGRRASARQHATLVDIGPSLLYLLGLDIPPQMTGRPIFLCEN